MNAKQQREWEDDVTQPCAFPEPLAEVLTRENRELRAEVERLRSDADRMEDQVTLTDEAVSAAEERARDAEAIAADATTAAQNLRDELQGAQEDAGYLRGLLFRHAEDALEDLQHWSSYAGDYFAEKWDLADDLAKWERRRNEYAPPALDAEP